MLEKIIAGRQTGASRGAWRAAKAFGLPVRERTPKGLLTEGGLGPEEAEQPGAADMAAEIDPSWVEQNVQDSDGTLWFGETTTALARATVGACQRFAKPCLPVYPAALFKPSHAVNWITESQIKTLNVAGNGEGEEPGIADRVEEFLGQVLEQVGHTRV
jgi:hypothetical protein